MSAYVYQSTYKSSQTSIMDFDNISLSICIAVKELAHDLTCSVKLWVHIGIEESRKKERVAQVIAGKEVHVIYGPL